MARVRKPSSEPLAKDSDIEHALLDNKVRSFPNCLGNINAINCTLIDKDILEQFPSNYSIHVCTAEKLQNGGIEIIFRVNCKTVEEVKKFIEAWATTSKVRWRVKQTNPKDQSAGLKNLYWALYHCQCSNVQVRKTTLRPNKKHTGCESTFSVTVKRGLRHSRSKDAHLPEYPTLIRLKHNHNHSLTSGDHLAHADVSGEVMKKFKLLFECGHSPASAHEVHKYDLQKEYNGNFQDVINNRSFFPEPRWSYWYYLKLFKKPYLEMRSLASSEKNNLERVRTTFGESCVTSEIIENQLVTVICSPLMKRIHRLFPRSGEIAFLVSWKYKDRNSKTAKNISYNTHAIYVLFTESSAGGLPLGIIMCPMEKEALLISGLYMLCNLVGSGGFYRRGRRGPAIIIMDTSTIQKNSLKICFPESKLIVGVAHVYRTIWNWQWTSKHVGNSDHCAYLMHNFKMLLCAENRQKMEELFDMFLNDIVLSQYPLFKRQVQVLWAQRDDWSVSSAQQSTNYMNVTMQIVNGEVLSQVRKLNVAQLLDFVATRFESYYVDKLLGLANNTLVSSYKTGFLYSEKIIEDMTIKVLQSNIFEVSSDSMKNGSMVELDLGLCSCYHGLRGAPCLHKWTVTSVFNIAQNFISEVSDEASRRCFLEIAKGSLDKCMTSFKSASFSKQPCDSPSSSAVDRLPDHFSSTNTDLNASTASVTKRNLIMARDSMLKFVNVAFKKAEELPDKFLNPFMKLAMIIGSLKTDGELQSVLELFANSYHLTADKTLPSLSFSDRSSVCQQYEGIRSTAQSPDTIICDIYHNLISDHDYLGVRCHLSDDVVTPPPKRLCISTRPI